MRAAQRATGPSGASAAAALRAEAANGQSTADLVWVGGGRTFTDPRLRSLKELGELVGLNVAKRVSLHWMFTNLL